MAKISKNIKRLRVEMQITQSELAGKLFISPQAVSSWERGRTQPDIEMIGKLAEVFGVSTEEVIYGDSQIQELEGKINSKNTLSLVFAILGTLLVGFGLVILLVAFWNKIPRLVKVLSTLIPMLIGQSVAVYTYKKKFNSVKWREGASVLWSIGVLATVILSRLVGIGVFALDFTSALIAAILILPIIFLFKAASPMLLYLLLFLLWSVSLSMFPGEVFEKIYSEFYGLDYILYSFIMLVAFSFAVLFISKYKNSLMGGRFNYCLWIISIFALVAALCSVGIFNGAAFLFVAVMVAMYLLSEDKSLAKPFYPIGVLGLMGYSLYNVSCGGLNTESFEYFMDPFTEKISLSLPASIIFAVVILAVAYIYSAKNLIKNKLKLVYCILSTSIVFLSLLGALWFFSGIADVIFYIVTFSQGIILIVDGVINRTHFSTSVGIVSVLYIVQSVISYYADNFLITGFFLLLGGAALLVSNIFISKAISKDTAKIEGQAVMENE